MTRVVVTGLGIVSAAGTGLEANRRAVQEGRSGLGALTRFPSPRCGHFPVAEVDGVERLPGFPRTVALGKVALREAVASAGLDGEAKELLRGAAIAAGTCVGGMPETEAAVEGAASAARQAIDCLITPIAKRAAQEREDFYNRLNTLTAALQTQWDKLPKVGFPVIDGQGPVFEPFAKIGLLFTKNLDRIRTAYKTAGVAEGFWDAA